MTVTFRIKSVDALQGTFVVQWNGADALTFNTTIPTDLNGRPLTGVKLRRALVDDTFGSLDRAARAKTTDYTAIEALIDVDHDATIEFDAARQVATGQFTNVNVVTVP